MVSGPGTLWSGIEVIAVSTSVSTSDIEKGDERDFICSSDNEGKCRLFIKSLIWSGEDGGTELELVRLYSLT